MPHDWKPQLIDIFTKLYNIYSAKSNAFRAKSYKSLVNHISKYPVPIYTSRDAKKIPGITAKSLGKITEIIHTGSLKQLALLQKSDPDIRAKIELQKVLGIGAKFAEELVSAGIKSVAELRDNKRIKLTRMQAIGIKYFDSLQERIPHQEITEYITRLQKSVRKIDGKAVVIGAGSYYRDSVDSGDIDVIISFPSIKNHREWLNNNRINEIIKIMKKDGLLEEIITVGHNNMMGITAPNLRQIDIRVAGWQAVPFYLLYFGSGEEFARKIRLYAKKKGWKLTEWGLADASGRIIMNRADNEEEIFAKLGYNYMKPKNR